MSEHQELMLKDNTFTDKALLGLKEDLYALEAPVDLDLYVERGIVKGLAYKRNQTQRRWLMLAACLLMLALLAPITILSKKSNNSEFTSANLKNTMEKNDNVNNIIATIENKDIILNLTSDLDYALNISDKNVRNENSDFIIIGTVQFIDGSTNYNPTTNEYTEIQTIGKIKVDKVMKGNIKDNIIPFIRLNGVISFSEYEKGLTESQKAKLELTRTLTNEEKKTKYVSSIINDNINIEQGKTYLMYVKYNSDYDRYGIVFMQYGLREIDVDTMSKSESKILIKEEMATIKVKNNETGKLETIKEVIGDL